MNSTGLVGGIAILMILASGLGGPGGLSGVKASAFEVPSISSQSSTLRSGYTERGSVNQAQDISLIGASLSSAPENLLSRHVQIVIDGKVYSGTLFAEAGIITP